MELHSVDSSMIQACGYEATKMLLVFNSGKTYRYFEVPLRYKELLASDLKGSYMRDCVIDCYPYQLAKKSKRSSK